MPHGLRLTPDDGRHHNIQPPERSSSTLAPYVEPPPNPYAAHLTDLISGMCVELHRKVEAARMEAWANGYELIDESWGVEPVGPENGWTTRGVVTYRLRAI